MKHKFVIFINILLVLAIAGISCTSSDFNERLNNVVKGERFNIAKWEVGAVAGELWRSLVFHESPDRSDLVMAYFNAVEHGKTTIADGTPLARLRPRVEKIIQRQVRNVISELGIKNPADNFLGVHFPPLTFILDKPPDLLVTSPRDKIKILKEVRLQPDLTVAQMESLESQTEQLGVSALVTELGGIGTFPSFVSTDSSLPEVLNDAAHEWLHQYLAFKPLGFRYVLDLLGIVPDYDIVTINETVADMFGDEVGALVYDKYYAAYKIQPQGITSRTTFDFNSAMRNIRLTVDGLLAEGKVDEAEQYMENQRQYLQTKGYHIRKLNQAYFAFNGTYASEPTSVSPIGVKLKEVRSDSPSLKAFLDTISGVTNLSQLTSVK